MKNYKLILFFILLLTLLFCFKYTQVSLAYTTEECASIKNDKDDKEKGALK